MRLKSTKEITYAEDLKKAETYKVLQSRIAITAVAEEWMANEDLLQTALGTKDSLREKIIKLVSTHGKGDDYVRVGNYELGAKYVKGSEYIDGDLLCGMLNKKKQYKSYIPKILTEKVVYEVNTSKLIQLVERGILPASLITICTKTRPDRGTRVTVKDLRAPKRRKKNATH